MANAYKILVGDPEGKRPLARLRHRLEGNIEINVKEIGCWDVGWIHPS
jgi:hypothetical protein